MSKFEMMKGVTDDVELFVSTKERRKTSIRGLN